MSSIFQYSVQNAEEEPQETPEVFNQIKQQKQHEKYQIIPPVGIAKPELVESFKKNIGDEEAILKDIADAEAYERENPLQTAKREVLSHAARVGEGYFGGIGSLLNLITPELHEPVEEGGLTPYEMGAVFPGPEKLHEFTKEKTGRYLEPKQDFTKASQEVASDIGTMFSTFGLGFLSKLLLPIGGQTVKQIVKGAGGGEASQNIAKLGFTTLASMANLGNARRVAGEALRDAEAMIPQGVRFSAQPTQNAFNRIRQSQWFRTGRTPSKGPAMDEINRIEAQIQNGAIDAHTAMQLRRDINEARRQLGGFQLNPVADRAAARRYLDDVDRALLESMEEYGTRVNPQWFENYQLANQAFGITQRSRLISDVVERYAKPLQSQTAKHLFYAGGVSAMSAVPSAALAIPGTLAAGKTIQIMNRMIASPVLRNHYLNVMRLSTQGNAAQIAKEIEKFDLEAKKLEAKKEENRQD